MATAILSCGFEREISSFDSSMLSNFTNLKHLDLSHCFTLEPTSLITNILKCLSLKTIKLVQCDQFSEEQLTNLLCGLPNIEYADCSGTQDISFCNALLIVCSLNKLRTINLEPKYLLLENKDWKRMVTTFHFITFGRSIMRMFPMYGKYLKK